MRFGICEAMEGCCLASDDLLVRGRFDSILVRGGSSLRVDWDRGVRICLLVVI
jgi:hypothetical protein